MKFTVTILAAACLVALVNSIPVPEKEGLQSRALDRLVMVESDDDAALRSKRTIGILRQLFPGISQDVNPEAENQVAQDGYQAGSENNEVRVQFEDQGTAANQAVESELTPLEDIEVSDDENRNKRFLNFGFGANNSGTGGAAGGSGNFLFDIIRQAADGAARAVGTVYRVVAGTQSLGLGLSASRDLGPSPPSQTPVAPPAQPPAAPDNNAPAPATPIVAAPAPAQGAPAPPLVAGSGSAAQSSTPQQTGVDASAGRQDAVQEAVPGPVTRLFVIANRGISNLIQDLILRLAATSERIVNFKARLITSII